MQLYSSFHHCSSAVGQIRGIAVAIVPVSDFVTARCQVEGDVFVQPARVLVADAGEFDQSSAPP